MLPGRLAPMTIRASDVALGDLCAQGFLAPAEDECSDIHCFGRGISVVEIQDNYIGLPTIDARMLSKVVGHLLAVPTPALFVYRYHPSLEAAFALGHGIAVVYIIFRFRLIYATLFAEFQQGILSRLMVMV